MRARRSLLWASSVVVLCIGGLLIGTIPDAAASVVRITDDEGGNIGVYWSRFVAIRNAGDQVVIDGSCSSACTMVLGIVPNHRICVTKNAVLGFHAAYRSFLGFRTINQPATQALMNIYPNPVRRWIARKGGLGTDMIFLSGPRLFAMYRKCR